MTEPDPWAALRALTPGRIALGHAGGSLPTAAHLDFQLAHARARDAVHRALDPGALAAALRDAGLEPLPIHSAARDRLEYLRRPDLGRRLDPASRERLARAAARPGPDLLLVVADGLSAAAAQRHAVPVLRELVPRLVRDRWTLAPVLVAEQARVALGDEAGALLGARLVAVLIGERPGLGSPDSLGAYLTYGPRVGRRDSERNCVSNIRPAGLGYAAAAGRLHFLLTEARRRGLTGVALKDGPALPSGGG